MNLTMNAAEFGFAVASPAMGQLDGRLIVDSLKFARFFDCLTEAIEEKESRPLHGRLLSTAI